MKKKVNVDCCRLFFCLQRIGKSITSLYARQLGTAQTRQDSETGITGVPYGSLEMTSGAIQYGVPTSDLRFGKSVLTCAQNPKSDSFTCIRQMHSMQIQLILLLSIQRAYIDNFSQQSHLTMGT